MSDPKPSQICQSIFSSTFLLLSFFFPILGVLWIYMIYQLFLLNIFEVVLREGLMVIYCCWQKIESTDGEMHKFKGKLLFHLCSLFFCHHLSFSPPFSLKKKAYHISHLFLLSSFLQVRYSLFFWLSIFCHILCKMRCYCNGNTMVVLLYIIIKTMLQ